MSYHHHKLNIVAVYLCNSPLGTVYKTSPLLLIHRGVLKRNLLGTSSPYLGGSFIVYVRVCMTNIPSELSTSTKLISIPWKYSSLELIDVTTSLCSRETRRASSWTWITPSTRFREGNWLVSSQAALGIQKDGSDFMDFMEIGTHCHSNYHKKFPNYHGKF